MVSINFYERPIMKTIKIHRNILNVFPRGNRIFYSDKTDFSFGEITEGIKQKLNEKLVESFVMYKDSIFALSDNKIIQITDQNTSEFFSLKTEGSINLSNKLIDNKIGIYKYLPGEFAPSAMILCDIESKIESPVFYYNKIINGKYFNTVGSKIYIYPNSKSEADIIDVKELIGSNETEFEIFDICSLGNYLFISTEQAQVLALNLGSLRIEWIVQLFSPPRISIFEESLIAIDTHGLQKLDCKTGTEILSKELKLVGSISPIIEIDGNFCFAEFKSGKIFVFNPNLKQVDSTDLGIQIPNTPESIHFTNGNLFVHDIDHNLYIISEISSIEQAIDGEQFFTSEFLSEDIIESDQIGSTQIKVSNKRYLGLCENYHSIYIVAPADFDFKGHAEREFKKIKGNNFTGLQKEFHYASFTSTEDRIIIKQTFFGDEPRVFKILENGDLENEGLRFKLIKPATA